VVPNECGNLAVDGSIPIGEPVRAMKRQCPPVLALMLLPLMLLAACGPGEQPTDSSEDAAHARPLPLGYYQTDLSRPGAGDVTILLISAGNAFSRNRCQEDCSTTLAESGSYTLSRGSVRFYTTDANGQRVLLDRWRYQVSGATIQLRPTRHDDWVAYDVVGESLCDQTGGAWSDDDLGPDGLNCSCGDGHWGAAGCSGASAPALGG
jgi:hypothetical protein